MTRVLNALAPETAALIRARIAGKPMPPAIAKAPKSPPGPKAMVTQLHRYYPDKGVHVIQLPHHLTQARRFVPPPGMSANKVRAVMAAEGARHNKLVESIAHDIQRYMPNGIPGLQLIEYVRLSVRAGGANEMDDDNLSGCFKAVRDALCAYARWGAEWIEHRDAIGHADGWLKKRGVKWVYKQRKAEPNPRAHGIQIWLHCAPSSPE